MECCYIRTLVWSKILPLLSFLILAKLQLILYILYLSVEAISPLLYTLLSILQVRQMFDENRHPIKEAPPSTPVEIAGWRELPSAGSEILQATTEAEIRDAIVWRKNNLFKLQEEKILEEIEGRRSKLRNAYLEKRTFLRSRGFYRRAVKKEKESEEDDTTPQVSVVIKGDVDGSVEAILNCLSTYKSPQCRLDVLKYDVGEVTTSDIETAEVFNGDIYAFNVNVPQDMRKLATAKDISIREHNVIYKMIDDIKDTMISRIPPEEVEDVIGEASVIQSFPFHDGKKQLSVAGCKCVKGRLLMSSMFKVIRDGETLFRGNAASLKHFKKNVDEIKKGMECGVRLCDEDFEFLPGDEIVCFKSQREEAKLDWNPGF
ncbi:LOW QUALITY PROTEIN: translation initiation factor IF-2, mitochondrial-like [Argopecten irradians]|uniref:LOW QUALITY PROTEIN: translation initiation factor IF-2, mitochondrial-like n=1 Tax=Argopecten irradians TaxID=31199 RepID=UPI003720BCEA